MPDWNRIGAWAAKPTASMSSNAPATCRANVCMAPLRLLLDDSRGQRPAIDQRRPVLHGPDSLGEIVAVGRAVEHAPATDHIHIIPAPRLLVQQMAHRRQRRGVQA